LGGIISSIPLFFYSSRKSEKPSDTKSNKKLKVIRCLLWNASIILYFVWRDTAPWGNIYTSLLYLLIFLLLAFYSKSQMTFDVKSYGYIKIQTLLWCSADYICTMYDMIQRRVERLISLICTLSSSSFWHLMHNKKWLLVQNHRKKLK